MQSRLNSKTCNDFFSNDIFFSTILYLSFIIFRLKLAVLMIRALRGSLE